MTDQPDLRMAFGLSAMSAALKARSNILRNRDKISLSLACLHGARHHDAACAAVIEFLIRCQEDQVAAGEALYQFVIEAYPQVDAGRVGETLDQFQAEFDWQKRVDLS